MTRKDKREEWSNR